MLAAVLLIFSFSCKKDEKVNGDNSVIPVLTTRVVTDITKNTSISGGNITHDGGANVTARGVCWSTSQTPTISDKITTDGTGAGSFTSHISGLSPNTTYYIRAYATNSNGTGYGNVVSFTTTHDIGYYTFTDSRDGNVYKYVKIGHQYWMAENLRYLPNVIGPGFSSYTKPYYYVFGYNDTNVASAKTTPNYTTYGVLYNWPAAMNGGISSMNNPSGVQGACPAGWHLPSDQEWTQLAIYSGGESVAGGKLKSTGTIELGSGLWYEPNTEATNETGFTAHPGGYRDYDGQMTAMGLRGAWWSATAYPTNYAFFYWMGFECSILGRQYHYKKSGYSVRCVKD